jgi:hypothetical protein
MEWNVPAAARPDQQKPQDNYDLSYLYDITAKICRTHKFGGCAYRLSFSLVTAHPDNLPDMAGAVGPIHDEGFPALDAETPHQTGRIGRVLEAADLDREVRTGRLGRR